MLSFCDCETCKKIKKRMKYPKCDYCKEYHNTALICPAYKKVLDSTERSKEVDLPIEAKIKLNAAYFLDLANGKYTVYQEKSGGLKALRYGEPWRDLCGDNLIFYLMVELIETNEKLNLLEKEVDRNIELNATHMDIGWLKKFLNGEK